MRKSWARISLASLADFRGESSSLDIRGPLLGAGKADRQQERDKCGKEKGMGKGGPSIFTSPRSSWSLGFWKGQCSEGHLPMALVLPNIPNE